MKNTKIDETSILTLADDMAAAAASFSAHGYDTFVNARDSLKLGIKNFVEQQPLSFVSERRQESRQ
jgi:hypothetical protein